MKNKFNIKKMEKEKYNIDLPILDIPNLGVLIYYILKTKK